MYESDLQEKGVHLDLQWDGCIAGGDLQEESGDLDPEWDGHSVKLIYKRMEIILH